MQYAKVVNREWNSDQVFLCVVALVFAEIVLTVVESILLKYIPNLRAPLFFLITYVVAITVFILITLFYSRVRNYIDFQNKFGFRRPIVKDALLASLLGGGLAGVAVILLKSEIAMLHTPIPRRLLWNQLSESKSYFAFYALGSPLWEELLKSSLISGHVIQRHNES